MIQRFLQEYDFCWLVKHLLLCQIPLNEFKIIVGKPYVCPVEGKPGDETIFFHCKFPSRNLCLWESRSTGKRAVPAYQLCWEVSFHILPGVSWWDTIAGTLEVAPNTTGLKMPFYPLPLFISLKHFKTIINYISHIISGHRIISKIRHLALRQSSIIFIQYSDDYSWDNSAW